MKASNKRVQLSIEVFIEEIESVASVKLWFKFRDKKQTIELGYW